VGDEAGITVSEGGGDDLLGLVQKVGRVDQIGRRLQGRCGADIGQDGGHAVGMPQRVLARVQGLAGQQWLGKGACAADLGVGRDGGIEQRHDGRGRAVERGSGFHGPSRKSRTNPI
jgi:hypothetical protein